MNRNRRILRNALSSLMYRFEGSEKPNSRMETGSCKADESSSYLENLIL